MVKTVTQDYIDFIEANDAGSSALGELRAATIKNNDFAFVTEHGELVHMLPEDHYMTVHSVGGNPKLKNFEKYVTSVMDDMVASSEWIGATPITFADVLDSYGNGSDMIDRVKEILSQEAKKHNMTCGNGEWAVLGDLINKEIVANMTMTTIGIIPKSAVEPGVYQKGDITYAVVDHQNKPVFPNSDGVGTKTQNYLRLLRSALKTKDYALVGALKDSLAMKVDDSIKNGAEVLVVSDLIETRGRINYNALEAYAKKLGDHHGFTYITQRERVGKRLGSFDGKSAYNISGSAVSIIDEEMLRNPPRPAAGNFLLAIEGGSRSNGVSSKRRLMASLFGNQWQYTESGKLLLPYLTTPSTVFYGAYSALLKLGMANGFFHMSGGAYNGKLARPLAKEGLHAELTDLFPLTDGDRFFLENSGATLREAYGQWPMANEGFVSTTMPAESIRLLKDYGLKARVVSILEKHKDKTGVTINHEGEKLYFSGKEAA